MRNNKLFVLWENIEVMLKAKSWIHDRQVNVGGNTLYIGKENEK